MKKTIPPANVNPGVLRMLFRKIQSIIKSKKGKVQVTDLLSMLNFPKAVEKRIKKARGPISVTCSGNTCQASNQGKKVSEDIPGSKGMLGIIIHTDFSCRFQLNSKGRQLVVDKIEGLDADIPGPFNPDIDKIVITLPRSIVLEI